MPLTLALPAMGTRFELVLSGGDEVELRAAGEEAFAEIGEIERMISPFRSDSEVSRLHRAAGREAIRVSPVFLAVLTEMREAVARTDGLFDPTIGPLTELWGIRGGAEGTPPPDDVLEECLAFVGFERVLEIDESRGRVRLLDSRARLDVGAIGKGLAVDRALSVLSDAGVETALLHGGTSTVAALGAPPGRAHWVVALGEELPDACLSDGSCLSVSTPHGRSRAISHVIDPRTGRPTSARELAAVVVPGGAAVADALSTGLLVGDVTAVGADVAHLTVEAGAATVHQPSGSSVFT